MASKYHVGDVVQVVPTPYEDCPFNWTASMDKWLGRVVVITNCYHSAGYNADVYHIEPVPCESNQGFTPFSQTWSWCENCLSQWEPTPRKRILKFLKLMICSEVIGDGVRT